MDIDDAGRGGRAGPGSDPFLDLVQLAAGGDQRFLEADDFTGDLVDLQVILRHDLLGHAIDVDRAAGDAR